MPQLFLSITTCEMVVDITYPLRRDWLLQKHTTVCKKRTKYICSEACFFCPYGHKSATQKA